MPRADFYLIDKPRFRDDPLLLVCELAKRAFASEQPTLILARSQDQAEALDDTFDLDLFSPIRQDWLDHTDTYFHRA